MWSVVIYVACCRLCGLLYGMWAVVWCMGRWIKRLQYMWAVEWYVGCCSVCGLLYGMWDVVVYVGTCMV